MNAAIVGEDQVTREIIKKLGFIYYVTLSNPTEKINFSVCVNIEKLFEDYKCPKLGVLRYFFIKQSIFKIIDPYIQLS